MVKTTRYEVAIAAVALSGLCTACGTTHSFAKATVQEDQVTVKETYTIIGHATNVINGFKGVTVETQPHKPWVWKRFYIDNFLGRAEMIPKMTVNLSGQFASIASLIKASPTVILGQVNVVLGATRQWPASLVAMPIVMAHPLIVSAKNLHGTMLPATVHVDGLSLRSTVIIDVVGTAEHRTWTATTSGYLKSARVFTVVETGTITPVT